MAVATAPAKERNTGSKTNLRIRPLEDRVVIRPSEAEERTRGGIVLPDTAREKPQAGEVIAVGPGKMLDSGERAEMSLKNGDRVFYGKYSGTEIEIDGEKLTIVRESDVLGIQQ